MIVLGAGADDEEVGWDDDSDSESESPSTPQVRPGTQQNLAPIKAAPTAEPRRSNDQQSQADSESSYDVVSGAASKTPGTPKEKSPTTDSKAEDSDDDWE